ncbi:MAG: hypothetical protein CMQ37_03405 [Gammaproteobacteria bacterium]|nr:hypothetical protein [Gammaproteobacteria bacterium]
MNNNDLISRFKTEVLETGPESTLPCNLRDEWLDVLLMQADEMANLEELDNEDDSPVCTELLAAVLHIHMVKNGFEKVSLEESELMHTMELYAIELGMEKVSRNTEFQCEPATLETIFTNRGVAMSTRRCRQ